jgi:hypothetical protein
LNGRRADSESQFLAIKKFSWFLRWRLITPRQNQFFERIAGADSRPGRGSSLAARCVITRHVRARTDPTRWFVRDVARQSDAELALQ